jgi:hypothetical protein
MPLVPRQIRIDYPGAIHPLLQGGQGRCCQWELETPSAQNFTRGKARRHEQNSAKAGFYPNGAYGLNSFRADGFSFASDRL